jgi:hypothetical protein
MPTGQPSTAPPDVPPIPTPWPWTCSVSLSVFFVVAWGLQGLFGTRRPRPPEDETPDDPPG